MRARDDWNTIRLIAEIARTGSFSGAAVAMRLNQATVSRRVADLEEELGYSLFIRSNDGAQPTVQGAALASAAEAVCMHAVEFGRRLSERNGSTMPVVIAATEMIATHLLTPLALGLAPKSGPKAAEPLPPLRIVAADAPADILFSWTAPGGAAPFPNAMMTRLVGRIAFTPFYGAGYVARHGALPRNADELARHPTVIIGKMLGFDGREALGPWITATRDTAFVVDYASIAERTIAAGHAIGLLPCWMEEGGGLTAFSAGLPRMSLDLRIAADAQRLRDPNIRRVFDALGKMLATHRWTPDACRTACQDGVPCRGFARRGAEAAD